MTDRDIMKQALKALENSVDLVREDAYQAKKLYGNYPTRQGKVNGLKVLADDHNQAITALRERLAHCDRCNKKLGGEGDIHTCTPKNNQCGETCERAKMCATCAGVLTEFDEAVAAVDATLHHAVDHWQDRALKAEALLAQPEQEPVAWMDPHGGVLLRLFTGLEKNTYTIPLYTTPPQRTEQEPVAWMDKYGEIYKDVPKVLSTDKPLYTSPPQRPWVGLTEEERDHIWNKSSGDVLIAMEAKLKEKNT